MFSRTLRQFRRPSWPRTRGKYVNRHFAARKTSRPDLTTLTTLDPTRLRVSDHVDLSLRLRYFIQAERDPSQAPIPLSYYLHNGVSDPFPSRTAGFFYYHRPNELPFTAGAIRFRIAGVNPAAFSRGSDLMRPDGVPWEIPLSRLSRLSNSSHPTLRRLLLRDGLITPSELKRCTSLFPGSRGPTQPLLHTFDQPFTLSFETPHHIHVIAGDKTQRCDLRMVFHEQRVGTPAGCFPYSGSALLRFELSKLPEHANLRVALLRVVKIIEPPTLRFPDYDGYLPPPVEGQLVQRPLRTGTIGLKPWSREIDSAVGRPLALLLDGEILDHPRPKQILLHSFDQLFTLSFHVAHSVYVVSGGQKHKCDMRVFHEQRGATPSGIYPYTGRALVRFELSQLPEHANSRVAVLRVVKMIKPPTVRIPGYDGYLPPPVEGQLVQRPRRALGVGVRPWSREIDSRAGRSLALLLDNGELLGKKK